jgi:hypothetical protein
MAVAIAATNEQGDELAFYCRDCAFVFNSAPDGTGYEQVVATAAARYRMLRSLPIVRRNELILVISKTQRQAPG